MSRTDPPSDFDWLPEEVAAVASTGNGDAFQTAMRVFIDRLVEANMPRDEAILWGGRLARVLGMPFDIPQIL